MIPKSVDSLHAWKFCMFFCRLLNLFKNPNFRKIISGIPSECQNSLDQDQARQNVWPDLGPNVLGRLSADHTGRQRVLQAHSQGKLQITSKNGFPFRK